VFFIACCCFLTANRAVINPVCGGLLQNSITDTVNVGEVELSNTCNGVIKFQ